MTMLVRVWVISTPMDFYLEYKLLWSLWKAIWQYLSEFQKHMFFETTFPLPGIYPADILIIVLTSKTIHWALFVIAKHWKHPKCSLIKKSVKLWYIHPIIYYKVIEMSKECICIMIRNGQWTIFSENKRQNTVYSRWLEYIFC